ncbi:MAG: hypothetical protein JWO57_2985 [Pseudonocardiales bacterium]|nr:hypothetical protein [Pseudonocardiales bacterium]
MGDPVRTLRLLAVPLAAVLLLSGCSWFGGGKSSSKLVSVFSVKPGQCFDTPKDVKAELSKLSLIPCTHAHTQEAYAVVPYSSTDGSTTSAYPGNDVLTTFAQGACAQRYKAYVGVDYPDSKLFFTFLLPSARSWEQDSDRNVLCFVETTGTAKLTTSVKGSKQ